MDITRSSAVSASARYAGGERITDTGQSFKSSSLIGARCFFVVSLCPKSHARSGRSVGTTAVPLPPIPRFPILVLSARFVRPAAAMASRPAHRPPKRCRQGRCTGSQVSLSVTGRAQVLGPSRQSVSNSKVGPLQSRGRCHPNSHVPGGYPVGKLPNNT